MRVPRISLGKVFNVLQSPIGRMASWPMRNIKTFPSKQMYLYLSLVERKEAEFYPNIDRGTIWFVLNDLFLSLFPNNSWFSWHKTLTLCANCFICLCDTRHQVICTDMYIYWRFYCTEYLSLVLSSCKNGWLYPCDVSHLAKLGASPAWH